MPCIILCTHRWSSKGDTFCACGLGDKIERKTFSTKRYSKLAQDEELVSYVKEEHLAQMIWVIRRVEKRVNHLDEMFRRLSSFPIEFANLIKRFIESIETKE